MKKILILCGGILVIGAAYLVWQHSRPEHFGAPFTDAPPTSIAQLLAEPPSGTVTVEGEIVRQCPVSGCWFYLKDEKGRQLKVDLGKTLPQLPQRMGRRVRAEGQLVQMGNEPILAGSAVEFK